MECAVFVSYIAEYFEFVLDDGKALIFEDINPYVLKKFNLIEDDTLIGKQFLINFSERIIDEEDLVSKIESLIMILE